MSCCGRGKVPPVGWGVRDAVVAETLMTNIDVPEEGDVVASCFFRRIRRVIMTSSCWVQR